MNWLSTIRGLLFHGRIGQLPIYRKLLKRLEQSESSDREPNFLKEHLFTDFRKSKELILYGKTLNREQRDKLKDVQFRITESVSQGLVLGRYIDRNANIHINKPLEFSLLFLASLTFVITTLWFVQFCIELTSIQSQVLPSFTILVVVGIIALTPAALLFYISVFPFVSYKKYMKVFSNIMNAT